MAKALEMFLKSLLLTIFIIHQCVGPPTKNKEPDKANHDNSSSSDPNGSQDELDLEYGRYLKEVVEALESDAEFRKKLEVAQDIDFRSGKVAAELEYVNHNVRTKLDELKRAELQRLKQLIKESDRRQREGYRNDINGHNQISHGHVDHLNEHTFEVADLHKLITKVKQDLDEADRRRRQEFKEYEMQKQFEQEQKMKTMDEEHKKKYLEELEAQKKKHQQHEPLHHPGSKAQLEEVWEKEDHMENQKFNPKTFFHLHDLDGNGYWDEEEVKALFLKELQKLYEAGAAEDDMRDKQEEMERMREHVFAESDTNRDRLISYAEFLEQTKKKEFERDEGWESIDERPQFTQQEYEEFEKRRQEEIQRLIDQGLLHPYAPGMMQPPPPQYGVHPSQFQNHPGQPVYAQHPQQVPPQYQYGNQVQYHPNQIPRQQQHQQQQHQQQQQQQHQQQQQYMNQAAQQHPGQMPPQYHHQQAAAVQSPTGGAAPPQGVHHPNQIPQQVQYVNQQQQQVPPHPNQVPSQQQVKSSIPNSNEIPKNQVPPQQMASNNMAAPPDMQQQQQNNHQQPPQTAGHPPQQYQQSNNIPQQPQKQYQMKYESHSNSIGGVPNEKMHQQGEIPK